MHERISTCKRFYRYSYLSYHSPIWLPSLGMMWCREITKFSMINWSVRISKFIASWMAVFIKKNGVGVISVHSVFNVAPQKYVTHVEIRRMWWRSTFQYSGFCVRKAILRSPNCLSMTLNIFLVQQIQARFSMNHIMSKSYSDEWKWKHFPKLLCIVPLSPSD